jgi:hypothetical protein
MGVEDLDLPKERVINYNTSDGLADEPVPSTHVQRGAA